MMNLVLISRSAFSLCTFFSQIDNNDNNDKYHNNKHISIEIINFEKTGTTCDEYR